MGTKALLCTAFRCPIPKSRGAGEFKFGVVGNSKVLDRFMEVRYHETSSFTLNQKKSLGKAISISNMG